jgi:TRAP-type mannitol/chloroaromatic compound transport system permease large subunit
VLHTLPAIIGTIVAMSVCLAAMVAGGATERFAGALMLVVNFFEAVIQSRSDWAGPQYGLLAIDTLALAAAVGMVLVSDRAWTVGFAAYNGLTVLTHLAILLEPPGDRPEVRTWIYITGLVTWGYLIWACLLLGTISAWRRRGTPGIHLIRRVTRSQRRVAKL